MCFVPVVFQSIESLGRKKHDRLQEALSEWYEENVSDDQQEATDDWFMGNIDGLMKCKTKCVEIDIKGRPPYRPYRKFRVSYDLDSDNSKPKSPQSSD